MKDMPSERLDSFNDETLIKEFLLGRVAREMVLQALGPDRLDEIEYQKYVLQREIEWVLLQISLPGRPSAPAGGGEG